MSLWWELEHEVSWRPRQVVYIRMETDISALTYPNKKQAVCYPASTGGGHKGRREEEREGRVAEQEWGGSVPPMEPSPCVSLGPRGGKQRLAYKAKHDGRFVAVRKHLIRADVGFVMLLTHSEIVQGPGVSQMVELRPRAFIVFIYCPPNCFVSSHMAHPCSYINRKLLMLHQTSRCSELQHRCTNIWCWITACFGFWLDPEWCKFNWKHLYRHLVAKFGFRKCLSEETRSNGTWTLDSNPRPSHVC